MTKEAPHGEPELGEQRPELHPTRLASPAAKRPKLKDKNMDQLVAWAWAGGSWCERAGNNHMKVYPADPTQRMITIPSTPSDHRTFENKKRGLGRAGIRTD